MAEQDDRAGLDAALAITGLTLTSDLADKLLHYVALLRRWQRAQNLVAPATLDALWIRHIADSLQMVPLVAKALDLPDGGARLDGMTCDLLDMGSGGGFPGMVIAITAPQLLRRPVRSVLVESNGRKCAFLRTVSRETNLDVEIVQGRLEALQGDPAIQPVLVTARALAPLNVLVGIAHPWLRGGATAFFHKGGEYKRELSDWRDADSYHVIEHGSAVDFDSRILQIRHRHLES